MSSAFCLRHPIVAAHRPCSRCGSFICRPCCDRSDGLCLDCLERAGWTADSERLAFAWVGAQQRKLSVMFGVAGVLLAFPLGAIVFASLAEISTKLGGLVAAGLVVGVMWVTKLVASRAIHLRAAAWCDTAAEKYALPRSSLEALAHTLRP